ncbi:YihY/virulence factor BrkB family protein [Alkalicoccus daliensis]|uniref:Membrane protein n=1 Tax=Alkalicoccus daliensis TaxID=745820 RepID=A0A1H0I105_9BACI|nr:YihY/virulence factor BrkB family protein [Alkalicoccus daliensis]SDO25064.1 membrane protein [Alkalicoccus daliensis]
MKSFWRRFQEHQLINLGAQCAYFLLLSIFPFLLVIVSLFSFLPFTLTDVYLLLENTYVPPGVLIVIEEQWNVLTDDTQPGLLSIGALLTLWTASLALNSILGSLNLAYNVTEDRGFIKQRLIAIVLTIAMFFVVIVALVMQVAGVHVQEWLGVEIMFFELNLLRWLLSSAIIFLVFLVLYWIGPSMWLRFRDVYIGALVATAGWQLVSYVFSVYVSRFADFAATYGTIGTVIAVMIWFHLISLILLIGGEINAMKKDKEISKKAAAP